MTHPIYPTTMVWSVKWTIPDAKRRLTMKIVKKIASVRHFAAISMLAVLLSIFSAGAGKAAAQSNDKGTSDPVISSMTWESPTCGSAADGLTDDIDGICNTNTGCPTNCINSPGICPSNCNVPVNC